MPVIATATLHSASGYAQKIDAGGHALTAKDGASIRTSLPEGEPSARA